MFSQSKLAQLYPHLNLSRTMPPSAKQSEPPKPVVSVAPVVTRAISIERPKRSQTPQPVIERAKTPEPPKIEAVKKNVTIVEAPVVKPEVLPESTKVARPNRAKVEPKPTPVRESQIPKKGERGLQRRYTADQRKGMYLDRLSRKSVKNAEREVEAVTDVLEKAGGTEEGLVRAEKAIRGQLRLINYAKYFCQSEEIEPVSIITQPNGESEPDPADSADSANEV